MKEGNFDSATPYGTKIALLLQVHYTLKNVYMILKSNSEDKKSLIKKIRYGMIFASLAKFCIKTESDFHNEVC